MGKSELQRGLKVERRVLASLKMGIYLATKHGAQRNKTVGYGYYSITVN